MRKLAILIPGSPTTAFYSQISAVALALKKLTWSRWEPTVYAYFGADYRPEFQAAWARWRPHLRDVEIIRVSEAKYLRADNWAQVDATINLAPRDADVLMSMDADTLPVRDFEHIVDQVAQQNQVAGVIAHFPVPPALAPQDDWARWAAGLGSRPVDFSHVHTLVGPDEPLERRRAPFYVNGGVVFYSRQAFNLFAPRYLTHRARLMELMEDNNFSGQVAFTLTVNDERLNAQALPMRYNFPNDPIAERLHPGELKEVVIYHYLRTATFDRHQIFASAENYQDFLGLQLEGVNRCFQDSVRQLFGASYPFA